MKLKKTHIVQEITSIDLLYIFYFVKRLLELMQIAAPRDII